MRIFRQSLKTKKQEQGRVWKRKEQENNEEILTKNDFLQELSGLHTDIPESVGYDRKVNVSKGCSELNTLSSSICFWSQWHLEVKLQRRRLSDPALSWVDGCEGPSIN